MRHWMLLLAFAPLLAAQPTTGTVEGTVVNSITKEPIAGAEIEMVSGVTKIAAFPTTSISIGPSGESREYKATTGPDGGFRITGVAAGEYRCLVDKHDFAMSRPATLHVVGAETVPLAVELAPFGKVRGRVLDSDGRPVPHARVEIRHPGGGSVNTGSADAEGRFELGGLGTFTLLARPAASTEPPPPSEKRRMGWAPTYYPRALERAEAERIVLRAGAELDGYDLRPLAVPVYHVRGSIRAEDGRPGVGVSVSFFAEDEWNPEFQTVSGKEGAFDFPSARARNWEIRAESKRGETGLRGFATATVSHADMEGLTIQLSPPFSVEVRVTLVGADKLEPGYPLVIWLGRELGSGGGWGVAAPDGTVRIRGIFPGRHWVEVGSAPPGYYFDSVFLAGRDVTGQVFELSDGGAPIRLVFKPNPARITGTVEGCANQTVALWQLDDLVLKGQWFHEQTCHADGRFDFSGLRPGTYSAYAFEQVGDEYLLEDLAFARDLRNRAASVHVAVGETADIQLKLSPWPE